MYDINVNSRKVESVYNNHYFRLTKQLQILVGLWPYRTGINRVFRRWIVYINLFITMFPLINGVITWWGKDLDVVCENLVGMIYLSVVFMKFAVTTLCEQKLKHVYEQVAINWLTITDSEEQAIMVNYAKQGRIKSIGYAVYMVAAGITFSQIPLLPILLDYVIPLNESRERILFVRGEFVIDPYAHYYKLYLYFMLTTCITVCAFCSIDTTYTVVAHQNLGIFSVVEHRLKLATLYFDSKPNFDYNKIIQAIHLHKDALQFIGLIETSYSLLFLIIIGCTIAFLSIASILMMGLKQFADSARIVMMSFGTLVHLFYLSWPGQMVMDHSHNLFESTYTNEWYNISPKAKVLLKILMLRCVKPCVFTAGGLYVMNFENFGSIIKTCMSYITVAISVANN